MSEEKKVNAEPVEEEHDFLKLVNDQVTSMANYMKAKKPDRYWMAAVQEAYWGAIYRAHAEGKKLILCGTNTPTELVYAFDAVPFVLETAVLRLASSPDNARYLDIADQYVHNNMCGIDRGILGMILSGDIKDKPDAMIYTVTPCDSARVSWPAIAEHLGVPAYCIDTPYRKDEQGYRYIADQLRQAVKVMEEVTGKKLDWDKFAEVIKLGNKAASLLTECSKLRQNVPCPLPGRMLVLNGLSAAMLGSQAMVDFLQAEYDMGIANLKEGKGVCPGEEKFRVIWLQNMLWSNVGIMDWLEKKYNAVVIMDAFGYQGFNVIEDPYDEESVFMGLAHRVLGVPMIHGASGPAEPWLKLTDNAIEDYKINVSMFVGHVGCKHLWAAGKLVKDAVYEKFGLPTLTFDIDGVDIRYKSDDEVKEIISQYMDTLIENENAAAKQE